MEKIADKFIKFETFFYSTIELTILLFCSVDIEIFPKASFALTSRYFLLRLANYHSYHKLFISL